MTHPLLLAYRHCLIILSFALLTACGGSGGMNAASDQNQVPDGASISLALQVPTQFENEFCVLIRISGADFAPPISSQRTYPAGTQLIETVVPNIPVGEDRVVEMGIFENGDCGALDEANWIGRAEGVVIRNSQVTVVDLDLSRQRDEGIGSVVIRGDQNRETVRLHGEVVTTTAQPIPGASCEVSEEGVPLDPDPAVVSGSDPDNEGVFDSDVDVRPETNQLMLSCTAAGFANTTKLADRVVTGGVSTFVATVVMRRGVSIQVVEANAEGVLVQAQLPSFELATVQTPAGEFQRVQDPEGGLTLRSGGMDDASLPEVPMLTFQVALPLGLVPGATDSFFDISVEVEGEASEQEARLWPVQPPARDARGPEGEPFASDDESFKFDRQRYLEGGVNLDQVEVMPLSGDDGDLNVIQVSLPAVQYDPQAQTMTRWPTLNIRVAHDPGQCFRRVRTADGFAMDDVDQAIQTEILSLSLSSVSPVNAELVRQQVCPIIVQPTFLGARFVIISPPALLPAANALRVHKIGRGISTLVASTTTTGTTANAIRNYLDNAYDNWFIRPRWVLLMGDSELIPTFYDAKNFWDNAKNAGDIRYAQPDLSGIFAFLEPVTTPRFGMGRFPVDTLAQAQQMVDNVIAYENNPPLQPIFGQSYYSRQAFAAQFQDDGAGTGNVALDGKADRAFAQTTEEIRSVLVPKGFAIDRIYRTAPLASNPTQYIDGTPVPAGLQKPAFPWNGNSTDIINAVNDGRSILYHRDHGWWTGWGTPSLSIGNLGAMSVSNNEFPVVYSINCASGIFDNETVDLPANTEPGGYGPNPGSTYWAETFVRKSDGAIAVIGDTRSSGTWFNNDLAKGLFDATWPDVVAYGGAASIRKVGDILNHAKLYLRNQRLGSDFAQTRQHMMIYNVLGDPTVEVKSRPPRLIVIGPVIFAENAIEIPVVPEPCLTCPPFGLEPVIAVVQNLDGEVIARGLVQDGVAQLDLGDFDGEEVMVTVSGRDVVPETERVIRPDGEGQPDVVVPTFEQTGPVRRNAEGNVVVPVRAVVRNQGTAAAPIFKASVSYTNAAGGTFVVAFSVPSETSLFYPFTDRPLGPGRQQAFDGELVFLSSLAGETVTARALGDSCSGEEFVEPFCRVDESNEGNNLSAAIEIALTP